MVVVHGREIVEAVGVTNVLIIGEILGNLFLAAMEIAEMRRGFEDHFAIGAENDAQHAVSGRVLRPHVDEHLLGGDIAHAIRLAGSENEGAGGFDGIGRHGGEYREEVASGQWGEWERGSWQRAVGRKGRVRREVGRWQKE